MGITIEAPGPEDPVTPSQSLVNYGTVTAPGANANIASITAPPLGVYDVKIYLELSGTITAAEQDNIRLIPNGAQICNMPLFAGNAAGVVMPMQEFTIKITSANITVQARNAGGVAAVYTCLIIATLIG